MTRSPKLGFSKSQPKAVRADAWDKLISDYRAAEALVEATYQAWDKAHGEALWSVPVPEPLVGFWPDLPNGGLPTAQEIVLRHGDSETAKTMLSALALCLTERNAAATSPAIQALKQAETNALAERDALRDRIAGTPAPNMAALAQKIAALGYLFELCDPSDAQDVEFYLSHPDESGCRAYIALYLDALRLAGQKAGGE